MEALYLGLTVDFCWTGMDLMDGVYDDPETVLPAETIDTLE